MLRSISAFFLTGVMVAGGWVAATDNMAPPASASSSVSMISSHTELDTASEAQGTGFTAPVARGTHTLTNAAIRAAGGIPPCKYEDASRQVLPCYWNAKVRGNGEGRSFIAMPSKGDDPRFVYLTK